MTVPHLRIWIKNR